MDSTDLQRVRIMAEKALKSSLSSAEAARVAVEDGCYAKASTAYASASESCLKGLTELYCSHASALISAEQFEQAKTVAETSLRIIPDHSQSWYFKGAALFKLSQYKDAKQAFQKAADCEKDLLKKTSFMDWVGRCKEPDEVIDITAPMDESKGLPTSDSAARTAPVTSSSKARAKPVMRTRREWYQSTTHVNLDIYAKNVDKDESSVLFEEDRIHIKLKRPDTDDYVLDQQLYAPIVPSQSSWNASRFKVEVKLKKLRNGEAWRTLDKEARVLSAQAQAGQDSIKRRDEQEARQRGLTSFAESELKNYKEDDSAMSLFRTIYKDADEDMRRAMMKSYSESGGKVLSTNWEDVKKEKVTYDEDD